MIGFENFENQAGGDIEESNASKKNIRRNLPPVEEELVENEDTDTPNALDVNPETQSFVHN
jgi:hypothetical protein